MPKQTRSQRIVSAVGKIGKEMGGAVYDFFDGVVDVTYGESHRQNNALNHRQKLPS